MFVLRCWDHSRRFICGAKGNIRIFVIQFVSDDDDDGIRGDNKRCTRMTTRRVKDLSTWNEYDVREIISFPPPTIRWRAAAENWWDVHWQILEVIKLLIWIIVSRRNQSGWKTSIEGRRQRKSMVSRVYGENAGTENGMGTQQCQSLFGNWGYLRNIPENSTAGDISVITLD